MWEIQLKVGNIVTNPELLSSRYDVITAFRFLLNVEAEVRRQVLTKLRSVIHPQDGRLIVNMHGNRHSLRHPAIVWRRRQESRRPTGVMLNEMSPHETRELLSASGFKIEQQFGFGVLPPTLYRGRIKDFAFRVDQTLSGDWWGKNCCVDLLYVCRPV